MFWFLRRRKLPTQEFTGYVHVIADGRCWLIMNDQSDPTMPREEWEVALNELPPNPKIGQRVHLRMWTEWELL